MVARVTSDPDATDTIASLAEDLSQASVTSQAITSASGEPIDGVLQRVIQLSELLYARALLQCRRFVDDACRTVNNLQAEILLGSGVILPAAEPDDWRPSLEPLQSELAMRAQVLLEISEQIDKQAALDLPSDSDPVPGKESVEETQTGPNAFQAEDAPAGDSLTGVPAPPVPPVRISDLARNVVHEARTALRAWSSAIELADLAESRDRIAASVAAIGAEIARRDTRGETSDPSALEHQYPPSVESLAALESNPDHLMDHLGSVGELLALELTLRTVSRLTHVLELSLRDGETEYVSWNPDAVSRSIALAHMLQEIDEVDQDNSSSRSLSKARHCLEWGLPEAALMYLSNHLLGGEIASEIGAVESLAERARDLSSRFAGGETIPLQVAISYAWPLLSLATEEAIRV